MLITSLLLFSCLVTASRPGGRRRGCVQSPPASIAQSTSSLVTVSTSSAAPITATTIPEPFLLQIQARDPQSPSRLKRQEPSGSYVEQDSSTSPRCQQGALFQLLNGRLLKEGVVVTVSDPPRTQPLLGDGGSRDISITFSFTDGTLSWSNPRFPRQTAFFCLLTGTVYVYFDVAPEGCVDITLFLTSLSECPGRQALPSTAASSTLSTLGSQLSSTRSLSSRAASSTDAFLGSAPGNPGTSRLPPTAAGTPSGGSTQSNISRATRASPIVTTISSWTTVGPSLQMSSSLRSWSNSSVSYSPPKVTPSFSSTVAASSSHLSTSSTRQLTRESPISNSATIRSSSRSLTSSVAQPTRESTSFGPGTTGSSSHSSIPAVTQPTQSSLGSSSTEVASSSQSPVIQTSQPTSETLRPSSSTVDSSRAQSTTSESSSTQSVASSQGAASFSSALATSSQSVLSPTTQSTSPATASSSLSILSSTSVTSSEAPGITTQSSSSSTTSAGRSSSSTDLPSLTSTLTSSASSTSTFKNSGADTTSSSSSSIQSVESVTSTSTLSSETYATSAAASTSTTGVSTTSGSETTTSSSSSTSSSSTSSSSTNFSTSSSSTSSSSSSSSSTSSSSSSGTPSPTPLTPLCPPAPELSMNFGFITDTIGSYGYSGQSIGDSIAFYATGSTSQGGCPLRGYVYHVRSGLCVTATSPPSPAFPRYQSAFVQLQPCGSFSSPPPESQLFCGGQQNTNPPRVVMAFKGDFPDGGFYYGSATDSGSNVPVSLRAADRTGVRSFWVYACQ